MPPTDAEREAIEDFIDANDATRVDGWARAQTPDSDLASFDNEVLVQWNDDTERIAVFIEKGEFSFGGKEGEVYYSTGAAAVGDFRGFESKSLERRVELLDTALDAAVDYMDRTDTSEPFPSFSLRISGGILDPLADFLDRFGGGKALWTVFDSGIHVESAGFNRAVEFEIPAADLEAYEVDRDGAFTISTSALQNKVDNFGRSDVIPLALDASDDDPRLGIGPLSESISIAADYTDRRFPEIDTPNFEFTAEGLNFKKISLFINDDPFETVVLGVTDGIAIMRGELEDTGETATARFETTSVSGEGLVTVDNEAIADIRRVDPRFSETDVTFAAEFGRPLLAELSVDGTDVDIRIVLADEAIPIDIRIPPAEITPPEEVEAAATAETMDRALEAAAEAPRETEPGPTVEPPVGEPGIPGEVGPFQLRESRPDRVFWAVDDGTGVEAVKPDGVWVVWVRDDVGNRKRIGATASRAGAVELAVETLEGFRDAREARGEARGPEAFSTASFRRLTGNDITGAPLNALAEHFDTIDDLRAASLAEVRTIEGVGPKTVEDLEANFGLPEEPEPTAEADEAPVDRIAREAAAETVLTETPTIRGIEIPAEIGPWLLTRADTEPDIRLAWKAPFGRTMVSPSQEPEQFSVQFNVQRSHTLGSYPFTDAVAVARMAMDPQRFAGNVPEEGLELYLTRVVGIQSQAAKGIAAEFPNFVNVQGARPNQLTRIDSVGASTAETIFGFKPRRERAMPEDVTPVEAAPISLAESAIEEARQLEDDLNRLGAREMENRINVLRRRTANALDAITEADPGDVTEEMLEELTGQLNRLQSATERAERFVSPRREGPPPEPPEEEPPDEPETRPIIVDRIEGQLEFVIDGDAPPPVAREATNQAIVEFVDPREFEAGDRVGIVTFRGDDVLDVDLQAGRDILEALEAQPEPVEEPEPEPEPIPVEEPELTVSEMETAIENATVAVEARVLIANERVADVNLKLDQDAGIPFTVDVDSVKAEVADTRTETVANAVRRWENVTNLSGLDPGQVDAINEKRTALNEQFGLDLPLLETEIEAAGFTPGDLKAIVERGTAGVLADININPATDSLRIAIEADPRSTVEFTERLREVQGTASDPVAVINEALDEWARAVDEGTAPLLDVTRERERIEAEFDIDLLEIGDTAPEPVAEPGEEPAIEPGGIWGRVKEIALDQRVPAEDRENRIGELLEPQLIEDYPELFDQLVVGLVFDGNQQGGGTLEETMQLTLGGDLSVTGKSRLAVPPTIRDITATGTVRDPEAIWQDFEALVAMFDPDDDRFAEVTEHLVAVADTTGFRIESGMVDYDEIILEPDIIREIASRNTALWQDGLLGYMEDVSKAWFAAQQVTECAMGVSAACALIEQRISGTNRRGYTEWYLEHAYTIFLEEGRLDPRVFVEDFHDVFRPGETERKAIQRRGPVDLDELGRKPAMEEADEPLALPPGEPPEPEPEPEPTPPTAPEQTVRIEVQPVDGDLTYRATDDVPEGVQDGIEAAAREVLGRANQFDRRDMVGTVTLRGTDAVAVDLSEGRRILELLNVAGAAEVTGERALDDFRDEIAERM